MRCCIIQKPEIFVSDRINCGVYVFTPEIFTAIQGVSSHRKDRANLWRQSSFEALQSATRSHPAEFVRLDQDILSPLAGKKQLYTYETIDFLEQIKTPGNVLKMLWLVSFPIRYTSPHLLTQGDDSKSATIIGMFIFTLQQKFIQLQRHPTLAKRASRQARIVQCLQVTSENERITLEQHT